MEKLTQAEFAKKYGNETLAKFAINDFNKKQGYSLKEAGGDIKETFQGAVESVSKGFDTQEEARTQVETGEISPMAGTVKTIGGGLKAGAGVVGNAFTGLLKLLVPQEGEEAVKEGAVKTFDFLKQSPIGKDTAEAVQSIKANYDNLTPEQKAIVDGLLGGGEAVLEATGLGKGGKIIKEGAEQAIDLTKRSVSAIPTPTIPTAPKGIKGVVTNVRYGLSDIDPQVETVLKKSTPDEVNTYFQHAKNAKADPSKATPLEIAGTKAESAYDVLDKARKNAIQGKKNILENVADQRVSGNTINDVMSTGIQRINEKFGVSLNSKGVAQQIKGRVSQLDAQDAKLVQEYFTKLNSLGVSPTVKQVDDFVDWAQSQLYKQSKTLSKLDVASDPIIRELQGITGDLNGKLKDTVGGGYGEVNARISTLIELQDELSRALGADARKGGGLMKTLFSPAGGNTRRIFTDIQNETGIDLFKEATLAKYAMETVGDVRQASLLKQLDIATQKASELDLTKPASIIKFLRENADLDGQELANEIMRRQKVQTTPTPQPKGNVPVSSPKSSTLLDKVKNAGKQFAEDMKNEDGFFALGDLGGNTKGITSYKARVDNARDALYLAKENAKIGKANQKDIQLAEKNLKLALEDYKKSKNK